ncbi:E3 ubiquitin-protein ligase RNF144B [Spatholobus suberectus]|nr:E3 ubiquitin-protein ligase RNF144B [Spatholobus suberectus]
MGNNLCVIVKTKRKANTKPTPSTLNLETILESYVPPHHLNRAPVYTCEICCESRPVYDSFTPDGCGHFYCTKCTLKYIVSKLQNNVLNLKCPELGCRGTLSPHFCKPILPSYVLVWWEKALCESGIPEEDKFYCPFKDCSALLLNEPRKGVAIRASNCPHCKRNICVQCRAPWHAEISCDKFQKLKDKNDDLMLDLAKRRKWRRCPNCKHYVEKKQGCDDMTCRCSHRFCYNCGDSIYSHVGHDCFDD